MAITISGENNIDRILASDGVLDSISGINAAGIVTATSFTGDLTGDVTGNLTGNVNATSNLLLQIGGSEKFRVASSGQLGIGGANYGTSGQVLTSGGSGSAATWSTVSGTTINNNANNRIITGSGTANTLEAETSLEWNGTDTLTVVHPSSYPDFKVRTSAGGGSFEMFSCGNGPFRIRSASTSPDSSADELVVGATSGDRGLTIFGSSNNICFGDADDSDIGRLQYVHSDNSMRFFTNTSERVRITDAGRVGINETSPDYMLHISGSVPAICLEDTDGTHGQAIIEQNNDNLKIRQDAGNASSGNGSNIRFEVDASEKVRITPSTVLSASSFVSKATADVNVTISTASGFTANTYVTVINHGVLEEESVYIISFKWNHGSSGQQPYFSHGAFVFNPSAVNTGSTGGQGPNYSPFQGHHMHTGVNRYWSFRYYGATGGTSVHGLQAAFDQTLNQSSGTLTIRATKIAKVTTI